ncbi:MAG: heavy-metal-associated domain-containing protein [Ginsengibacter sp.]
MKKIFFVIAIIISLSVNAQVTKVSLQASGLTCSMCSNAINKALKTIDFVDKIEPNIKTSNFDITFKPGSKIDFDKLKNKVEDAGFFVSRFIATVRFDNVQIKPGEPVAIGDKTFQFVNFKDQVLNGDKALRIIDKGFLSAKEYKKNAAAFGDVKGTKIYHVVI